MHHPIHFYEYALANWPFGQTRAEQMCGHYLSLEGYRDVQPQSPRGGPDGRKDIVFKTERGTGVAGCYFPTTPRTRAFGNIKAKFDHDVEGALCRHADLFVFFTGQRLTLAERQNLRSRAGISVIVCDHDALIVRCSELAPYMSAPPAMPVEETNAVRRFNDVCCLKLIIKSCDFYYLDQAFGSFPNQIGSPVVERDAMFDLLESDRLYLYDQTLEERVVDWWLDWTGVVRKTQECYDLQPDGSITLESQIRQQDWGKAYIQDLEPKVIKFRASCKRLLEYIRANYPDALWTIGPNGSLGGGRH